MARIAVAATAPFGADVLERLAATARRVDAPDAARTRRAGRGRRLAAPPAKEAAERLGIPVLQPDRPTAGLDLGAETVVVCAYGLLIPEPTCSTSGRGSTSTRPSSRAGAAPHRSSAR